jgi:hypothetical protein
MDMETETDMKTETNMETEMETDNTRTWTWNWRTFAKYIIWCNCPDSAMWNASEISRRNFQRRYKLVAPLHNENNDMKIFRKFIPLFFGIGFQMKLAELELSV